MNFRPTLYQYLPISTQAERRESRTINIHEDFNVHIYNQSIYNKDEYSQGPIFARKIHSFITRTGTNWNIYHTYTYFHRICSTWKT